MTDKDINEEQMTDHDYEAGKRDGKIESLQEMQTQQNTRLDAHDNRLRTQERITYALLGAIALIELLPALQRVL